MMTKTKHSWKIIAHEHGMGSGCDVLWCTKCGAVDGGYGGPILYPTESKECK